MFDLDLNNIGDLAIYLNFMDDMDRYDKINHIVKKIQTREICGEYCEWGEKLLQEVCNELGYSYSALDNWDINEIKRLLHIF